jgi:alpha-beta hydrolase superfamily lysophospholipase
MNINMTNSLYYEHLSSKSNPKGVVIISHGMAEHIGRYEWLISKLNFDGYHVISKDHRGHGRNIRQGELFGFFSNKNGWIKVRDDQETLIKYVNTKYTKLPSYLLAHSMGSWIALSLLNNKLDIDGIILSGSSKVPFLLIYLQLLIIKIEIFRKGPKNQSTLIDKMTIRKFNNFFAPNRTPNDWISSDIKSVDNYTNDPLCGFIVTNSLWNDVCLCMLKIFKKNYYSSSNLNIPIMIISGKNDAANAWSKYAQKLYLFLNKIFKSVQLIILNDSRHEVFTDIQKDISYNHLKEFITR